MSRAAPGLLALLLLAACSQVDEQVLDTAENVLTLQSGTVSELMAREGRGPFRRYPLPPDAMLPVIERAIGRARDRAARPVESIRSSAARRTVIAKERPEEVASDAGYSEPWASAVVVFVESVRGHPDESRVEIHATDRGPFHAGVVQWERDLPGWIREELADRALLRLP